MIERAAAGTVVTVDEMRAHSIIYHNADDAWLQSALDAAQEYAENHIDRAVQLTRWRLYFDQWPRVDICLPRGPIRAIEAVRYIDIDGAEQMLMPDQFHTSANSTDGRVRFKSGLPSLKDNDGLSQVHVQFITGYGQYIPTAGYPHAFPLVYQSATPSAYEVPKVLRQAMQMLVGFWYENRETVAVGTITSDMPHAATDLLHQLRVLSV